MKNRTDLDKVLKTLTAEKLSELYMRIFNTDDGELLLQDLKNRCFAFIPSVSIDSHQTYFNEGMRSVVLHIDSQLLPHQPVVNQED
jgi:hypothetical protein